MRVHQILRQRRAQRPHRLALSHGRTRRRMFRKKLATGSRNRKLHRTRKFIHRRPHRKMKGNRHRHKQNGYRHRQFQRSKKHSMRKGSKPSSVEKRLVNGVNKIIQQQKRSRYEMYNDWKNYFDRQGRQIVLL